MNDRRKKLRMIGILLVQILCLCGCDRAGEEIVWNLHKEQADLQTSSQKTSEIVTDICTKEMDASESGMSELHVPIYADICGAVQHPGVYALEEGARIFELIEKAGGLQEDADLTAINQAQRVTDGMKVRVYTKEEAKSLTAAEAAGMQAESTDAQKININSASQMELTELSGIGSARAADIIAYRTEHGRFQSIEEIMNVSGIKESTFQKIKDQIVVE